MAADSVCFHQERHCPLGEHALHLFPPCTVLAGTMKLFVVVQYPNAAEEGGVAELKFTAAVGSGSQSVKWLALMAVQRFAKVRRQGCAFHGSVSRHAPPVR